MAELIEKGSATRVKILLFALHSVTRPLVTVYIRLIINQSVHYYKQTKLDLTNKKYSDDSYAYWSSMGALQ